MRRQGLNILAILTTTCDSEKLHLECFKAGGDDYLVLPLSPEIILAHVEARLKERLSEKLRFDDVEVDTQKCTVHRNGHPLDLAPTEYKLLVFFLEHPERVLSRDEIFKHVWRLDSTAEVKCVDSYVSRLRKKLEGDKGKRLGKPLIHTRRGLGYILTLDFPRSKDIDDF